MTEEKKKSYIHMKDVELRELMADYAIDEADYTSENDAGTKTLNRVMLAKTLTLIDVQVRAATNKLTEAAAITDNGEVVEDIKKVKLHKKLSGMMVNVMFYNVDENDLPYVQMGLNGIALIVPREQKVWIPKEFIDGVLNNCIQHKMKMVVERDGKVAYQPKAVHRFQHTVHDIKHIDVLCAEFDEQNKKDNRR